MKIAGIIVGAIGAILFVWHYVNVAMGRDVDTRYISHQTLSLVGGIIIFLGIGIYVIGRRRSRTPRG